MPVSWWPRRRGGLQQGLVVLAFAEQRGGVRVVTSRMATTRTGWSPRCVCFVQNSARRRELSLRNAGDQEFALDLPADPPSSSGSPRERRLARRARIRRLPPGLVADHLAEPLVLIQDGAAVVNQRSLRTTRPAAGPGAHPPLRFVLLANGARGAERMSEECACTRVGGSTPEAATSRNFPHPTALEPGYACAVRIGEPARSKRAERCLKARARRKSPSSAAREPFPVRSASPTGFTAATAMALHLTRRPPQRRSPVAK